MANKVAVTTSKTLASAKQTAPAAKKAAAAAKKPAPVKKAAPPVKKAAPAAKKAAPPVKKAAPTAKKAAPPKKAAPAPKKAAPVKKAAPAPKKAAPVKKAAPAPKKAAPVAKKAAPAPKKAAPTPISKAAVAAAPIPPKKAVPVPVKKAAPPAAPRITPVLVKKAVAKKVVVVPTPTLPPVKGETKEGIKYTKDFDVKFLTAQRKALLEARESLTRQAVRLEDEAFSLIDDEMGDVQFDDESGEGDTMVVERERDLALSAQARHDIAEIDAALHRISLGSYGYSVQSMKPIPRERLEVIPWSTELVEEKVGGIGRR